MHVLRSLSFYGNDLIINPTNATVTNGKLPFYTHSHISGLDYVQSSVSVDAMGTVALQINQYLVESFGPPGTIGTLGEVVIVAQVVLTALEFFFRGLLEAVPYGLQNDGHPPVQCGQVRFPENRCNWIGGQRLSHSLRQRFRSIVEQQQRLQRR